MATTYDSLLTTTLVSNTTSFTISPISQAYSDLVMVIEGPPISENSMDGNIQFNGDGASNYSDTRAQNLYCDTSNNASSARFCAPGNGGRFMTTLEIIGYSQTNTYKTYLARGGSWQSGGPISEFYCGLWRSTAPINSITVISGQGRNFIAGTKVNLFGILAAAV